MTHPKQSPPIKVTVLGCASSGGVPLITGNWGNCDPDEPKNRRRRCSIFIESPTTNILVDAGPDLRAQMLDLAPERIDALIITHDHADHTHGLDDMRFMVGRQKHRYDSGPLPVYMSAVTHASVLDKFGYLFASQAVNPLYPGLFEERLLDDVGAFTIGDINFQGWQQPHGRLNTLGFRINDFAYCTDCVDLDDSHFQFLEGLDTFIVDCVRHKPHMTHAHVDMMLEWVERLKPKQTYTIHMSHELDYGSFLEELPEGVEPLYDGVVLGG